jgi:glycosyltransferase involved in cell wall biosynthesis/peptidoglycan/xylan/chitin deacetylase (PgdA/CDA1 family)
VRILQIHNRYREAGGEDTMVSAEAALLKRNGHEVRQHQVANPGGVPAAMANLALSAWNPSAAHRVAEIASDFKPDLAHVHNFWFSLTPSILWMLHRLGVPVVLTVHNYRLACTNALLFREGHPCTDCVGRFPWRGVVRRCYRSSLVSSAAVAGMTSIARARSGWKKDIDLTLALTHFAKYVLCASGFPEEKVVVKDNFVPDEGRRTLPPSSSETVMIVGRLSSEKGIGPFLDAWAEANTSGLELVVIGDGPLREELSALRMVGVQFLGRRPRAEVRRVMRRARALAFPSLSYEGQPLVLLEALAAGLPVIASDHPPIADSLAGLDAGWLVPPVSKAGWVEALGRLRDSAALNRYSTAARSLYESRYSEEVGLAALERAYSMVTETRGGDRAPGNSPRLAADGRSSGMVVKRSVQRAVRRVHVALASKPLPRRVAVSLHALEERAYPAFKRLIEELRAGDYSFCGPDEYARCEGRIAFVSFDDNYRSWYTALGLLDDLGVRASFYVNTLPLRDRSDPDTIDAYFDRIDHHGERAPLSTEELIAIAAAGHKIGSHTHSHHNLASLSRKAAVEEIEVNRCLLEKIIGAPVKHFSVPFGLRRYFPAELGAWCLENGFDTVAAAIPAMQHGLVDPSYLYRHPWRFDRSFEVNWQDLHVDGRRFERITGRSAVG